MVVVEHVANIDKSGKKSIKYLVKCLKCGREKVKRRDSLVQLEMCSHRACSESIQPKDELYYKFRSIYSGMRTRTTNPNQPSYVSGYRDVSSDSYSLFIDFYDDHYASFCQHFKENNGDTTIDRIDPHGDYVRENIRWATKREQNDPRAKRGFRWRCGVSPNGEEFVFSNNREFARQHNLTASKIGNCLNGKALQHKKWVFKYLD